MFNVSNIFITCSHCFKYKLTALHVASFADVHEIVRLLLNFPDVDAEARSATFQMTPLHLAAAAGSVRAAGLLLSKSVRLLVIEDYRGYKPLHLAARHGKVEMIAALVGQGGIINTTDNHGWVPLHHACRYGHLEAVKLLLELGASIKRMTRDDRFPISLAAASGYVDVFMYLLHKEHDTNKLIADKHFVFDLMVLGRLTKQKAIEEFILVSKSPLETSARLYRLFLAQATSKSEFEKDLETSARFCERVTSSLMTIGSLQSSPSHILKATDSRGKPFIDSLLDDSLKAVVAESAVQRYLTQIWRGPQSIGTYKSAVLFFAFAIFPPLLYLFSLPLPHGYHKVPAVKFIAQMASHFHFIALLSTVAVSPIYPISSRESFWPTWNEYLLVFYLAGNLTAQLTNPTTGGRGTLISNILIIGFSSIAVLLQLVALCYDLESYDASILMYSRNIVLSIPVFFAVLNILDFLTFNERFGPLTIILNYIIQDTGISTAIVMIFFIGWWLQLCAIYSPVCPDLQPALTQHCICNLRVPTGCQEPSVAQSLGAGVPGCRSNEDTLGVLTTNLQMLYFALFHHGDYAFQPSVRNTPEWALAFKRFQLSIFHIVMVLTLLTIIVSTSADTYERMNKRSDLEWKFERARLIRNMIKTSPTPSPLNLLVKPFIYLRAWIRRGSRMCTSFAPYYVMQEEDDDEQVRRDLEQQLSESFRKLPPGTSMARRMILWLRRRMFSKRVGVALVPAQLDEKLMPSQAAAVNQGEEGRRELGDVIDWKSVIDRFREVEADELGEDEFIRELSCNLSDLEEWQRELWKEAEDIEEEEERDNYRRWLIQEFKEVVKAS